VKVLSVDLACASYANLGIVVLEEKNAAFAARPLASRDLGLTGTPSPQVLAASLATACRHLATPILLLDGPQGWKHPENGLIPRCEQKSKVNINLLCLANPPISPFRKGGLGFADFLTPLS
jgi:hypothetical protein